MKIVYCIFFFLLFIAQIGYSQKVDFTLTKKVKELLQNFKGDVGVYIKNLRTQKTVAINADTIFPTASIIKVPILLGLMDKINRGEFTYHQDLVYRDSLAYSQYDVVTNLKDSAKIEMAKVIMLMLTTSDNTASLWLQKLSGTGLRINQLLDSLGLQHTKVNSRTPGREQYRTQYGWGQTTPYEMATLLEKIYTGNVISDSMSKRMLRLLGRNFWDEQAIAAIPPNIFVASKNGCVDASRSEVLLVEGKQPYIFSIFTKNNKDVRWVDDNEAWVLAKKISALLWQYYGKQ
ncbi:MAG: serine hydrolase [Ferruginibacter sp.]|nr:serine hydrolase [Ferruginibacter sp.]